MTDSLTTVTSHKLNRQDRFPRWLLLLLIVFAAAMLTWQILVSQGMGTVGDTGSYLNAWDVLKTFHPDIVRPPVYPIIVGICVEIFGDWGGLVAVCVIQWAVWIFGLRVSWNVMMFFKVGRRARLATILLLMPFYGGWVFNNVAQTEAFATGLMPLFLWELIRYIQTEKPKYIILAIFTQLFFIFLKPQFFNLIPVLAVSWIYVTRRNRRRLLLGILVPVSALAMIWLYMWSIKRCYCLPNTFSIVTHWNGYNSMRMAGLIKVDEIENPEAREKLRPFIEADPGQNLPDYFLYWSEMWYVWHTDLAEIWQHAYELHRDEANAYILGRFRQGLTKDISVSIGKAHPLVTHQDTIWYELTGEVHADPKDLIIDSDMFYRDRAVPGSYLVPLYGICTLPFWFAWLFLALFSAMYIRRWWLRRRFPVVAFTIAASIVSGYITAYLGAYGDWGRLVTPYTMPLFIAGAVFFTNVKKSLTEYRQRRAGLLN